MAVASTGTGTWIRQFHPAPETATRLVCFPHAGGSASFFFPVSRAMSPAMQVLAVQYPGRQDRRGEQCVDDVRELADGVLPELLEWSEVPLVLFGHSLGAMVAFEVALRLQAQDVRPLWMFASGRRAPSCQRGKMMHLYDDEALIANLRQMSGTDAKILGDEEILRMVLPSLRSDYKAAETYRCGAQPPVSCPVTVLMGDDDSEVTYEEAEAWREHTAGDFELKVFAGGHFFLVDHAEAVLDVISSRVGEPLG